MSELKVGDLYEKNGQTEFPRILILGNSIFEDSVRYRWNGNAYAAEIIKDERKLYGSGK